MFNQQEHSTPNEDHDYILPSSVNTSSDSENISLINDSEVRWQNVEATWNKSNRPIKPKCYTRRRMHDLSNSGAKICFRHKNVEAAWNKRSHSNRPNTQKRYRHLRMQDFNSGGAKNGLRWKVIGHSKKADHRQLNKKIEYQCKSCPAKFKKKSNCLRHETGCKFNSSGVKKMFQCTTCKVSYNRKDNLNAHLQNCKSQQLPSLNVEPTITSTPVQAQNKVDEEAEELKHHSKSTNKKTPCLVEECNLQFYHKLMLIKHLKAAHQTEVAIKDPISRQFSSFQEFISWKEKEEKISFSYFSRKNGNKMYYYCQHDGPEITREKKTARVNSKGKIKVGHYCIAKMKVWSSNQKVFVEYYPTHSHPCKPQDLVHHPVPQSISQYIDSQLVEGVSPSEIHSKIRDIYVEGDTENVQNIRINMLTKKAIRERARRQGYAKRLHQHDGSSVFLHAEEDCLPLYKPLSEKVVGESEDVNHLTNQSITDTASSSNIPHRSMGARDLLDRIGQHLEILIDYHTTAREGEYNKLSSIESFLSQAACTARKPDTVPMKPAVTLTPNEKLKTQLSQLLLFKRPAKRKISEF